MKTVRFLFAFVLALGLTAFAKADDFEMVVLDPSGSLALTEVTSLTTLTIAFTPCVEGGQIPVGSGYQGCFSFQNETGVPITGLDILVTATIPGQTAGCALSGLTDGSGNPLDVFSDPSCEDLPPSAALPTGGYELTYTGGSIPVSPPGTFITIAESGVAVNPDGTGFPPTEVTFISAPEPASVSLLSTGLVAMGSLFAQRRKRLTGSRNKQS